MKNTVLSAVLLGLFAASNVSGATRTFHAVKSGAWDDTTVWDVGGQYPGNDGAETDDVYIQNGYQVTLQVNVPNAISMVYIGGGSPSSGYLDMESAGQLTIGKGGDSIKSQAVYGGTLAMAPGSTLLFYCQDSTSDNDCFKTEGTTPPASFIAHGTSPTQQDCVIKTAPGALATGYLIGDSGYGGRFSLKNCSISNINQLMLTSCINADIEIDNCSFDSCYNLTSSGSGTRPRRCVISNNVITNTGHGEFSMWLDSAIGFTITGNTMDKGIFFNPGKDCLIANNNFSTRIQPSGGSEDIFVIDNAFSSTGQCEAKISFDSINLVFMGNESHSSTQSAIWFESGTSTFIDEYYHSNSPGSFNMACSCGSQVCQVKCYNCRLDTTPVSISGFTQAGSYAVSYLHNGTLGSTSVWGDCTLDNNVKFNYADPSYHAFATSVVSTSNTGNGTLTVISTPDTATQSRFWQITCTAASAGSGTFSVKYIASGSTLGFIDANPSSFTCPGTYTEAGTSLQFQITAGSTMDYAAGDMFRFCTVACANDAGTKKKMTAGWCADTDAGFETTRITVPAGRTLELTGGSTLAGEITEVNNWDLSQKGFSIRVNGAINANNYHLSGLGFNGLKINAGANVLCLDNGTFDDGYYVATAAGGYFLQCGNGQARIINGCTFNQPATAALACYAYATNSTFLTFTNYSWGATPNPVKGIADPGSAVYWFGVGSQLNVTFTPATKRQYADDASQIALTAVCQDELSQFAQGMQVQLNISGGTSLGLSYLPAATTGSDGKARLWLKSTDTCSPVVYASLAGTTLQSAGVTLIFVNNLIRADTAGEVESLETGNVKVIVDPNVIHRDVRYYLTKYEPSPVGIVEPKYAAVAYDITAKALDGTPITNLDGQIKIELFAENENGVVKNSNPSVYLEDASRKLAIGRWSSLYWLVCKAGAITSNANGVSVEGTTDHLSIYGIVGKPQGNYCTAYPNPFTPLSGDTKFNQVTFNFTNEDSREVEIKIWDISGSLVRTLPAGTSSTMCWDGRNDSNEVCESGVYIYQVKVNGEAIGKGTLVLAR